MRVLLAFFANACVNFVIGLLIAKFLGPEEYGRFALAFAITTVVQTALYDWLRLATTRFYSGRTRETAPYVRGTLAACFLAVTAGLFVVPHLATLNTGHAIVARAVLVGLRAAVTEMLALLKGYRP